MWRNPAGLVNDHCCLACRSTSTASAQRRRTSTRTRSRSTTTRSTTEPPSPAALSSRRPSQCCRWQGRLGSHLGASAESRTACCSPCWPDSAGRRQHPHFSGPSPRLRACQQRLPLMPSTRWAWGSPCTQHTARRCSAQEFTQPPDCFQLSSNLSRAPAAAVAVPAADGEVTQEAVALAPAPAAA